MISESYRSVLAETHSQFSGWGTGSADRNYYSVLECGGHGSILDFGCGKGELVDRLRQNGFSAYGYDPAVAEYSVLPERRFDLVVCFDVLEHVEEEYVDAVVATIFSFSRRVLLDIALASASQVLSDGRNAHLTVRPAEWWLARLPPQGTILRNDRGHLKVFFR